MTNSNHTDLRQFSDLPIEWDLAPADAVTLYLEWGNNNWHSRHIPVRSKSDFSNYFVLDKWEDPTIRLVRRNSENALDLLSIPLPEELAEEVENEFGNLKGVFEPSPAIKEWLKDRLYA